MRLSIRPTGGLGWRPGALGAVMCVGALAAACSTGERATRAATAEPEGRSRPVAVVTTVYALQYFAERVGGGSAQVVNLVAPGVETHDFEPAPGDIRRLDGADVVLYNGAGLEPWLDRALDAVGTSGRVVVNASEGIAEAYGGDPGGRGTLDPHVWLDPLKAMKQVESIRDGLVRADPANRRLYERNAAALQQDLGALHRRFADELAGSNCAMRRFATSHNAFGYLARRYALEAVPISGLSPEVEPGPRDLARLADRLRALGVAHVLVEPLVSARLAGALAGEIGATLLPLHPLESLTPGEAARGETYMTIMADNLANLRTALRCGA